MHCHGQLQLSVKNSVVNKGDTAIITGAHTEDETGETFYKVNMNNETEGTEPRLFNERELAYAMGCPILYSPSKLFDDSFVLCIKYSQQTHNSFG